MSKIAKEISPAQEIFTRNFNRYLDGADAKQIEIAAYVGVSSGTVSDWKFGRAYPRMDKVQLIAEFFGVQTSDLVNDINIAKEVITDKDQEALDLLHKIPEEKREFVLSMIRAAINNL